MVANVAHLIQCPQTSELPEVGIHLCVSNLRRLVDAKVLWSEKYEPISHQPREISDFVCAYS